MFSFAEITRYLRSPSFNVTHRSIFTRRWFFCFSINKTKKKYCAIKFTIKIIPTHFNVAKWNFNPRVLETLEIIPHNISSSPSKQKQENNIFKHFNWQMKSWELHKSYDFGSFRIAWSLWLIFRNNPFSTTKSVRWEWKWVKFPIMMKSVICKNILSYLRMRLTFHDDFVPR